MAALKAQCERLGLPKPCASSAMSRRATAFRRDGCWSCRRAANSMPYVVIEAAAAGIPILAASVGGIPEILGRSPEPCSRRQRCRHVGRHRRRHRQSARRATAPKRCASASSGISRKPPWSTAFLPPTPTPLPSINRSLPSLTKSCDFSLKPWVWGIPHGSARSVCACSRTDCSSGLITHARCSTPLNGRDDRRRRSRRASNGAAGCRPPRLPSATRRSAAPIRRS